MTLLLASVTGPDEAALVLAHGADIIDLKDASNGALGALAPDVVRATVAAVRGRRPVSAVSGDLPMEPQVVAAAVGIMARTGVDYVKVGLFPGLGREQCVRALAPLARTSKIIGVMFADCGADNALVQLMADCGFVGAMLDTADKRAGRLLDCMDAASLRNFVSTCRDSATANAALAIASIKPTHKMAYAHTSCGLGRDQTLARIDPARGASGGILRAALNVFAQIAQERG